jgi:hypothetical protein
MQQAVQARALQAQEMYQQVAQQILAKADTAGGTLAAVLLVKVQQVAQAAVQV